MMTLAIETATAICAAALVSNGVVIAEHSLREPHIHSEKLLTLIDAVIAPHLPNPASLDGIAVSIGPGSFTGLRIGLSVAKGLCFAWSKPMVPVSTLHALSWNALVYNVGGSGDLILPMIDARRDEVYAAVFRRDEDDIIEIQEPAALTLQQCRELIQNDSRLIVAGDATGKFLRFIQDDARVASQLIVPPEEQQQCSAASVGILGERLLMRGEISDIASMEPMYVKEFVTTAQQQR